jgi:hypothetical protein
MGMLWCLYFLQPLLASDPRGYFIMLQRREIQESAIRKRGDSTTVSAKVSRLIDRLIAHTNVIS